MFEKLVFRKDKRVSFYFVGKKIENIKQAKSLVKMVERFIADSK